MLQTTIEYTLHIQHQPGLVRAHRGDVEDDVVRDHGEAEEHLCYIRWSYYSLSLSIYIYMYNVYIYINIYLSLSIYICIYTHTC